MTTELVPLVVDMDGTFFSTDSNELMLRALRWRPLRAARARQLVRAGDKAAYKLHLHRYSRVSVDRFVPYQPVQAYVKEQSATRPVYLATGAPQALADEVCRIYPMFSGAFGTSEGHNNTAERKARVLVERFGEGGFDYAGNSPADLAVWSHARRAVVCNAPRGLTDEVATVCEIEATL